MKDHSSAVSHLSSLQRVLVENDRRGETAIALSQALVALIVFGFHFVSAYRNQWATFSPVTIGIAAAILGACLLRLRLARSEKLNNLHLNILSVIDGALIFLLIGSYSWAYDLPLASSFKAPSIIFLVLYTCVRVLKLDPVPILVAGGTVLVGWIALLLISIMQGATTTKSYVEYVASEKILIGATIEMAVGYLAVIAVLYFAASYARKILANSAGREELIKAMRQAELSAVQKTALLETSSDGVLIVDNVGIIEQCNPALENMFGHDAGSLIGQSAAVLMSPQNAVLLADDVTAFTANETSRLVGSPFESEGVKRNGSSFPIELSISGFKVDENQYFAGFIRDISSRIQSTKNEQAAIANLADVVTSALDAIVVIDQDGRVVEFNPAAENIFGYKSTEVVGHEMAAFIIPDKHKAAHREGMAHYLKTGEGPVLNQRIEIEAVRADGQEILVELAIRERVGEEGSLFFGYMRDITQKKADEIELVEAKDRAEIANRAKASFLAMMSHEIRTPLNGVLGILTLLSDTARKKEEIKLITAARSSGQALLTLINDILDFSKLEAGKLDLQITSFNLKNLISGVSDLAAIQAQEKNITFNINIDDKLPEYLQGDQDRIRQIVLNLVSNAVKFTDNGEIALAAKNKGSIKKPVINISVSDTGIGIEEDKLEEVFAEFSTINASYTRRHGGTGLGLSICKMLCEAMGGTIGVESKPDKGSTFWFEIPLLPGEASAIVETEDLEEAKMLLGKDHQPNILLAEDNTTNQLVIRHMLEGLGCTVDIVSDGVEAVTQIVQKNYDVILMDISMPRMDGLTAAQEIRAMGDPQRATPIIALTAYALAEDREQALASGMNDFVAKPVSRSQLAKAIARQLESVPASVKIDKVSSEENPASKNEFLDTEAINELMSDMPLELRGEITKEFINDVSRYTKQMMESADGDLIDEFERATHGLKGVSGTFGATALQALSGKTNALARNGNKDAAFKMILEIEKVSLQTIDAVKNWSDEFDSNVEEKLT